MAAAGRPSSVQNLKRPVSAAPTRIGASCASRMKCSQFLTKSIMTALPKVKWIVVPRGLTAPNAAFAASFSTSAVFSGRIHGWLCGAGAAVKVDVDAAVGARCPNRCAAARWYCRTACVADGLLRREDLDPEW